ncbi:hypothetical protein DIPPA_09559 [Diplonema papillatum]|nr:hypothetical protein DIPPA_09559 [Diplonema papillatum]
MPGKRKQCEEPTAEDLVDLFFNAQDAVEEGRADEAKGILKDCLEKIKEKLKTSDKSGDSGKQKPAKRAKRSDGEPAEHDDLPPLEVLQSAVYNTLGEVHLDDALILSGQQKLGKAPACKEAKKAFLKSIDSSLLKNNASACLSLASLARDSNDLKGAVEWYRKALEDPSLADDDSQRKRRSNTACGSWRDTWVINSWKTCREVAYYHLAILYCQGIAMDGLAVSWASREINSILQKFGFRFKLSKDVWNLSKKRPARGGRNPASASTRSAGRRGGAPAAAALPKPKMLLNAVSPQLKASLAESFSPSSPYWDETSYSGRGYFSWACDPEKPPTCTIEQLVHLVIDRSAMTFF